MRGSRSCFGFRIRIRIRIGLHLPAVCWTLDSLPDLRRGVRRSWVRWGASIREFPIESGEPPLLSIVSGRLTIQIPLTGFLFLPVPLQQVRVWRLSGSTEDLNPVGLLVIDGLLTAHVAAPRLLLDLVTLPRSLVASAEPLEGLGFGFVPWLGTSGVPEPHLPFR